MYSYRNKKGDNMNKCKKEVGNDAFKDCIFFVMNGNFFNHSLQEVRLGPFHNSLPLFSVHVYIISTENY